jgi:hypothetical protein
VTEATEAVARFRSIGGSLWLEGGRIRYRVSEASPEVVRLLETLRRHKPNITALLREKRSVDCAHCQGDRVCDCPACTLRLTSERAPCCMCRVAQHQAWVTKSTSQQTCWHCSGSGKCPCIVCSLPGQRKGWTAGPCVSCRGSGKGIVVVQ